MGNKFETYGEAHGYSKKIGGNNKIIRQDGRWAVYAVTTWNTQCHDEAEARMADQEGEMERALEDGRVIGNS